MKKFYLLVLIVVMATGCSKPTGSSGPVNNPPVPPTLTTDGAGNVTNSSATCGGTVVSHGGAAVTVRGVCWDTLINPTIADDRSADGTGVGAFTSSMTGLIANKVYYIRAYATNSAGTGYGNEMTLTTLPGVTLPVVSTTAITNITTTSATSGGSVTSNGGAVVTARGVCWSTTANPTIANSKTTDGTGMGLFTSAITGLTPATTYHVRAYATNSAGTAYGSDISFVTF